MKVNYNIFQFEGNRISQDLLSLIKTTYSPRKIITRDFYMLPTAISPVMPTTPINYALIVMLQQLGLMGFTHIMILA